MIVMNDVLERCGLVVYAVYAAYATASMDDTKRARSSLSPEKTPRKIKVHRVGNTPTKVRKNRLCTSQTIARLIANSEYKKAFRQLFDFSQAAKKALLSTVKRLVVKELNDLAKTDTDNNSHFSMDSFRSFTWDGFLDNIHKICPLLYTTMAAAIGCKKKEIILTRNKMDLKPALGMAISSILNRRNPRRYKLLQEINSVELWIHGSSKKVFSHLNHLGICVGRSRTLEIMSTLKNHSNDKILRWKQQLETVFESPEEEEEEEERSEGTEETWSASTPSLTASAMDDFSDTDSTLSVTLESSLDEDEGAIGGPVDGDEAGEQDGEEDGEEDGGEDREQGNKAEGGADAANGFTLVWDNVGKMVKCRHPSSQKQNKMMLWALSYAALNRIPSTHLAGETDTVKAADIPISSFLPSPEEIDLIKERMVVIVQRILVEYVPWFSENFSVNKHIPHKYSKESAKKSELVNLGVYEENPSSTSGVIEILKNLHQYVPDGDRLRTIVCFGDALSCERHNDAHRARQNEPTPQGKLRGLEPGVQEFHKRMLHMQDTMDIFFSGQSQCEKGTLSHLKELFQHKNVKSDVGDSFNQCADFMGFVTDSYVVLAALTDLGMATIDDTPPGIHFHPRIDKQEWFHACATRIVQMVWQDINPTTILEASTKDVAYEFCTCKTDNPQLGMIECSRQKCPNRWYHLECIDLDEDDVPDGDWYCSTACQPQTRGGYKYCTCKRKIPGSYMVACENALCARGSWFHYNCVGIDREPDGEWFCCTDCRSKGKPKDSSSKKDEEEDDYVRNYVTSLMWWGLMDAVRKDAVRENDGPAMMSHWKHDMILFHNKNHYKYVILGHRLLAGISGWLPARLRHDLIWNRTVNPSGGLGRNLEADLENEFLNRKFKGSLKDAHGNLTSETVHRHSQVIGPLSQEIEELFSNLTSDDISPVSRTKKNKVPIQDLNTFIRTMKPQDVFMSHPGREYPSFPKFKYEAAAKNPGRFKDKLKSLSTNLDSLRRKMGPVE